MPSPLTSSFASAAAGNLDSTGRRAETGGTGEWTRTRTNGATQTFRRPSLATTSSQQRDSNQNTTSTTTGSGPYVPPHLASGNSISQRNGALNENRYSKEQMLGLFRDQRDSGNWGKNIGNVFMGSWDPNNPSAKINGILDKKDEKEGTSGPEICWVHDGNSDPLGLMEMDDEEKELFTLSVNSPLKPPPSNVSKDGATMAGTSRKASVSQRDLSTYSSSPLSSRPGTRRRETGDSTTLANPLSPSGNTRFFRDEPNTSTPPPSLLRRKTDYNKESSESKAEERDKESAGRDSSTETTGFGSLKRSTTAPMSSGTNGPSSPWATTPGSGFSPMGAFGNFSLAPGTSQSPAGDKKPAIGSLRVESRFKGLLTKDSSEDVAKVKEKTSFGSMERLPELETGMSGNEKFDSKTRDLRSESNPFGDEDRRVGSAALGGAQDMSPPNHGLDQLGFSAFGLATKPSNYRDFMPQEYSHQLTPQAPRHAQEPMSPTNTNPYQSPEADKVEHDDVDTDGSDIQHTHLPGLTGLHHDPSVGGFGSIRRGPSAFDPPADRSQNSSAGGNRGFPNISGFPGLSNFSSASGWQPSTTSAASPSRGASAFGGGFGDSFFTAMGDVSSPSIGPLGGSGLFGSAGGLSGSGTIGRGSKMGSLFPAAMQEQMRGDQGRHGRLSSEFTDQGESIGKSLRGSTSVESGSLRGDGDGSLRGSRGLFGDMTGSEGGVRPMRGFEDPSQLNDLSISHSIGQTPAMSQAPVFGSPDQNALGQTTSLSIETSSQPGQSQSGDSPSVHQIPATQQRQMVMPDRMRWIYRDPQGNTQGPWSGLEMHDWYKAGFFTAELQVKKLEDQEYEPLAQLIRRIGNSREPFLVPQIGVPHGPHPAASSQWSGGVSGPSQAGVAQPPFANSFPSFGTTLTAEQQNALERRKQEEQYLMARQKEHLAQQQVLLKQYQHQQFSGPHSMHPQLQHHSSAHSLHSQPSFGSITSPSGYQPSPNQGPIQPPQSVPSFFESPLRSAGGPMMGSTGFNIEALNNVPREELPGLLDRINLGRGSQPPFSSGPSFGGRPQEGTAHQQQVNAMLQDRARLQREQQDQDSLGQGNVEQQAHNDRLRQFHALQSQNDDVSSLRSTGPALEGVGEMVNEFQGHENLDTRNRVAAEPEVLSLAEQVQNAQKAASRKSPETQHESPWRKVDSSMPQPFPPPQPASPLPAPAAQRSRQNVADQLAAESRSQNQTPIETPSSSIAPWAKESIDGPKGPSLKEIQEAEARHAAQKEETAAAARRAMAEQERLNQPVPVAPGLPSTSTWGSSGSPSTPTGTGSVWAKPAVGKTAAVPNTKKTLAQIQKEEQLQKQRAAAANAAQAVANNTGGLSTVATGKRYADLASKIATTGAQQSGGAWTTVGASGKVKTPNTPVVATPVGPRSVSGGITPSASAKPKPATTTRAVSNIAITTNQNKANDEFTKWAKGALKGLNANINVDDFVTSLLQLPPETDIISEAVYANSQTIDGRRFAEEFIRRRKLADKGVVESAESGKGGFSPMGAAESKGSSGGWSEVAKKGSETKKDDLKAGSAAMGEFRVVPGKKKGRR